MDEQSKFAVFSAVWVVLGAGSFFFFRRPMDPSLKRRWIVGMNVTTPVLFLGFVTWMGNGQVFWPMIPILAFITFMNLRIMKVCPKCSAVQTKRSGFLETAKFCHKCGAGLD